MPHHALRDERRLTLQPRATADAHRDLFFLRFPNGTSMNFAPPISMA
ncbi:hypothetical protein [Caballeronia sp. Lep1P3]|nr:hypothetical protein [Caballeronia sp. Lep1P3]